MLYFVVIQERLIGFVVPEFIMAIGALEGYVGANARAMDLWETVRSNILDLLTLNTDERYFERSTLHQSSPLLLPTPSLSHLSSPTSLPTPRALEAGQECDKIQDHLSNSSRKLSTPGKRSEYYSVMMRKLLEVISRRDGEGVRK